MSLSTKTQYPKQPEKMDRQLAITLLHERNKETFKGLGLMSPYFTIKFAYTARDKSTRFKGQQVINMFHSEISRGDDVYMELVDGNNAPLNDVATLYRLPYTADFEQEYEKYIDPTKPSSPPLYFVPLSMLELVDVFTDAVKSDEFELPQRPSQKGGELIDCHISELTARDRACIDLRVPESNKEWLNDLIRKSLKK